MQPEFWHERWRTGQIGFHQAAVTPHLERHWQRLGIRDDSRVFVPLCGKSLDLLWLRTRGHSVSGVEFSPTAVESFYMEHGIAARRRVLYAFDIYEAAKLRIFCGDYFALTPDLLGGVACVFDRAALISWEPERRAAYVGHINALTSAGTRMLLVTVEYLQAQMAGPPFSVSADEVQRLYAPSFDIEELAREDILANEPRLRARGLSELHEVCYALTRL